MHPHWWHVAEESLVMHMYTKHCPTPSKADMQIPMGMTELPTLF